MTPEPRHRGSVPGGGLGMAPAPWAAGRLRLGFSPSFAPFLWPQALKPPPVTLGPSLPGRCGRGAPPSAGYPVLNWRTPTPQIRRQERAPDRERSQRKALPKEGREPPAPRPQPHPRWPRLLSLPAAASLPPSPKILPLSPLPTNILPTPVAPPRGQRSRWGEPPLLPQIPHSGASLPPSQQCQGGGTAMSPAEAIPCHRFGAAPPWLPAQHRRRWCRAAGGLPAPFP